MITPLEEFKKIVFQRLEENQKSFDILFGLKHYGNCISIMRQELDQIIRLLFLLNSTKNVQRQLIESSINNHKWFVINKENKKDYITEEIISKYSESLNGWDKSIYEFGLAFGSLATTFNYGTKDPIKTMAENDRDKIYKYILEYHNRDFPRDYDINVLIRELPDILNIISSNLQKYMDRL